MAATRAGPWTIRTAQRATGIVKSGRNLPNLAEMARIKLTLVDA